MEDSLWPSWGSGSAKYETTTAKGQLEVLATISDASRAGRSGEAAVIATGISFLDHMVDQLTAHAQLHVDLRCSVAKKALGPHTNEARELDIDQDVVRLAGQAVGGAIKGLLATGPAASSSKFTFHAPLDEALAEVELDFSCSSGSASVDLAPYGKLPRQGREAVGAFRTAHTELFFQSLAKELGCGLQAKKLRGVNAHHIIEATFKSFARCFRRALDAFCGFSATACPAKLPYSRVAQQQRSTKETRIDVSMDLDLPATSSGPLSSGILMLDKLLGELRSSSNLSISVSCSGDLWIDEHHSAEDIMITLGKVLAQALRTKGGINRMGCAEGEHSGTRVLCVMDLSNRPSFTTDVPLDAQGEEKIGDLSIEMLLHCFESFVMNGLITVHFVHVAGPTAPPAEDAAFAMMRALGSALGQCAAVDPRRAGATASSKGTLSK